MFFYRQALIEGIAKARLWLDDLISDHVMSTAEIAKRERCSERSVRMTLGLAFLSPATVKAAIGGVIASGDRYYAVGKCAGELASRAHLVAR